MKAKRIAAGLLFVNFLALNAWAFYSSGVGGFIEFLRTMGPWEIVLATDLVIALLMVVVWMWSDARKRGRNPMGYTALTVMLGSIGTLLYVLLGKDDQPESIA